MKLLRIQIDMNNMIREHKLWLVLVGILYFLDAGAQPKPPLDMAAINSWPSVSLPGISNDGEFVKYIIRNEPVGGLTYVVRSAAGDWKREFTIVKDIQSPSDFFDGSGKEFGFLGNDTLFFVRLGTERVDYAANVKSFKIPRDVDPECVGYQEKSTGGLVVRNLGSGQTKNYGSVEDYSFDDNGKRLVLMKRKDNAVELIELSDGTSKTIFSHHSVVEDSASVSNAVFDGKGNQLAFMLKKKENGHFTNAIYYYQVGMDSAIQIIRDHSSVVEPDFEIDKYGLKFTKKGDRLFFELRQAVMPKPDPEAVKVQVWSYKDEILRSSLFLGALSARTFTCVIGLTDRSKFLRVAKQDEQIIRDNDKDLAIVTTGRALDYTETWLDALKKRSHYLVDLRDGHRDLIEQGSSYVDFSPAGKFALYYDYQKKAYFTYDVLTGKRANISRAIATDICVEDYDVPDPQVPPVGTAGWLENDSYVLLYDNYDIWRVDPKGVEPPVNITKGYGRLNHLRFRIVNELKDQTEFAASQPFILTAFNTVNKSNGYYRVDPVRGSEEPRLLAMGAFESFHTNNQLGYGAFERLAETMAPIKAVHSDSWIVQKMSSTEAPNYYLTRDFRTFLPLSDLAPQKKYNWLKTELVHWKLPDGSETQGILYLPENFDSTKRYPIIFHYYEKFSYVLNQYPAPEYSIGPINIPWFVSNGYLVFTPDIHYVTGKPGDCALNTVLSAVSYLSKRPYVDTRHMGLNGHSWGAFETDYIITHTPVFAAAVEAAGPNDFISGYGSIRQFTGTSAEYLYETSQSRMGGTLWQRRSAYLENSPILYADKIRTPLLILHNDEENVPWTQGLELYLAMRRMNKPAWMLKYEGEYHVLYKKNNQKDYTIRITQFFDHYLKGMPAPKWMTESLNAEMR